MNFNKHITKNFTWNELFKSEIAIRYGIDNTTIDQDILNNIRLLTENILQPVRDKFGQIRIASGYRCPEVNKLVGGSSNSNHVLGIAADIEPIDSDTKLVDILTFIEKELDYHELIAEWFPNGWVHVAHKHYPRTLKIKDLDHNYEQVTLKYTQELYEI